MNNETQRKLINLNMKEFADAITIQEKSISLYATMSFEERFTSIIDYVYQVKYNEKIKRRIKQAKLRYESASLELIDYSSRGLEQSFIKGLGTLSFIDTQSNIIIQGFTGSGKTFLGCSIAKAACLQDVKTFYIRMPDLMQLREESKALGSLRKLTAKLASFKSLVIDEWLLNTPSPDETSFLLELFELRYNYSSTIFITQYKIEDWHSRLGGNVQADAIMDRIVHNSIKIESGNVNMRERLDSKRLDK